MYSQSSQTSIYSTCVAIDWADSKHDLAIINKSELENKQISNQPTVIHQYFLNLCEDNGWNKVAVVIEKNRNLIMSVLESIPLLDIYTVHPTTSASYRNTFTPSGAKDDKKDSQSLLDLFLKHPEKVSRHQMLNETDILGQFCEKRRRLVDDRKAICGQLMAALKKSYPVVLDIFKDNSLYSLFVLDFLDKWPSSKQLMASNLSSISRFLNQRTSKKEKNIERIKSIKQTDSFLSESQQEMYLIETQVLLLRIRTLNEAIKRYEVKISELYTKNEDYDIIHSFHGAGATMGPRLLAFWGNDRERYKECKDALLSSEIAPVKIESGKSSYVRRRYLCNKYKQQTFIEYAMGSLKKSKWAQAFYESAAKRGKLHNEILRALAFKWIRIMYKCWKDKQVYSEEKYIKQLIKKRVHYVDKLLEAC